MTTDRERLEVLVRKWFDKSADLLVDAQRIDTASDQALACLRSRTLSDCAGELVEVLTAVRNEVLTDRAEDEQDLVNRPPHYTRGPLLKIRHGESGALVEHRVECLEVRRHIRDPRLSDAFKYLWRVAFGGKENDRQDIRQGTILFDRLARQPRRRATRMSGVYTPIKITVEIDGEEPIRETDHARAIFKSAEALARLDAESLQRRIDGFICQRDRDERYIDVLYEALVAADLEPPERP